MGKSPKHHWEAAAGWWKEVIFPYARKDLFAPWGLGRVSPVGLISWMSAALDQGLMKYGLWTKSILQPVFVDKHLLKHSHAHTYTHCLWLHLHYKAELSSCDRDYMAHKAENIYTLALYRNCLKTPVLGCRLTDDGGTPKDPCHHGWSFSLPLISAFSSLQYSYFFWYIWPLLIHTAPVLTQPSACPILSGESYPGMK